MKEVFRNTLIILCISLSILFLWEAYLRLFSPQIGIDIYGNGIPMSLPDRELGYKLRPNAMALHSNREFYPDYEIEYRVNSQGFRDHATYEYDRPRDTIRILLLGDSFTFGIGNEYSKIWPVVLEKSLQNMGYNVEVIKAGVYGYDTRREVQYLKQLYPKYRPDIVVVNFMPNDLFTNVPLEDDKEKLAESNRWAHKVSVEFTEAKLSIWHFLTLTKRLVLGNDDLYSRLYMATGRGKYYADDARQKVESIEVTKELFREGLSYLSESPTKLVVLSIPQNFQIVNTKPEVDVRYIDRELGHFARQNGFEWISVRDVLTEVYQALGEDLYFRLDGHLNNTGNRIVGEYFAEELSKILRQIWWRQQIVQSGATGESASQL